MLERIDFSAPKMDKETYKREYKQLLERLVVLQQQARSRGIGLVVLLEGFSGAGKGSRISDLMYELDARATTVHVTPELDFETARKFPGRPWGTSDFYPPMQQFWKALGERGTITFFDRGWYAVGIEQAIVDISEGEGGEAIERLAQGKSLKSNDWMAMTRGKFHADTIASYQSIAQNFERMLHDDGYAVIKLFVHVSKKAQKKRLYEMHDNPATAWRVSDDKLNLVRFYDRAYDLYDALIERTNFDFAPWTVVNGEDRRAANMQIAQALVDAIEKALAAEPDAAAEAAKASAAQNSAHALVAATESATHETESVDADAAEIAAAEQKAAQQRLAAPRMSSYIILAGYPQIDHSQPMPRIESDEEYKRLLKQEQERFYSLELEMYTKRVPLILMYEGWDAAGKGGNIKRVAQAIDARAYTIFPSPAPSKPELMHPHLWRYWTRLPKAGHVGIYDRSWYGRVLVERVEGFASDEQWARAYDEINGFEHELVQWGAVLLKFWVDITPEEQLARFEARAANPAKQWKITEEDWRNRNKYPLYKQAVNDMFRLTSTAYAPWIVLHSNDKHYARIQALQAINDALEKRLHG